MEGGTKVGHVSCSYALNSAQMLGNADGTLKLRAMQECNKEESSWQ